MSPSKSRRETAQPEPAPAAPRSAGKGRPTPRRKDAQARGLRPVVPVDRKAAKRQARAARDEAWQRQREAMATGDERYLPARDKGPVRRYVRDFVDARYCVGELFMPLTFFLMLLMLGLSSWLALASAYLMLAVYVVFLLAIGDSVLCWWQVRRRLDTAFGRDKAREQGSVFFYTFMRCMQLRRWRQPAPQVRRREFPA
ncbi:DUF3043 domain-containing protein [Actinomyces sp. 2119]|uniref:DUF3043 domain-containing protein n=1 Tax=Actinomyces lilanjuaniae TaxID=2321394 RepID=A0ABM6Z629_9ACTO|nr:MULTISPECIES: DUF3043 domain-containing protein [Actinomyces]AYD90826.1 DUF3043 domain-containing protein [Actinomyces lilanjuaniae]RJF44930.1 DUF3043 domain-containing protein [Actinomyces sp. 2119]